jgi:hypothetical protein
MPIYDEGPRCVTTWCYMAGDERDRGWEREGGKEREKPGILLYNNQLSGTVTPVRPVLFPSALEAAWI